MRVDPPERASPDASGALPEAIGANRTELYCPWLKFPHPAVETFSSREPLAELENGWGEDGGEGSRGASPRNALDARRGGRMSGWSRARLGRGRLRPASRRCAR